MTSATEQSHRPKGRPRGSKRFHQPREQLTAQIDLVDKEQARRLATLRGVDLSEVVRQAIAEYLAAHPLDEAERSAARRRGDAQVPLLSA